MKKAPAGGSLAGASRSVGWSGAIPRTQGRLATMNEKGNKCAIAALKGRRATLAGEVQRFKQGIRDRKEQLAHLDATLRILDPRIFGGHDRPEAHPAGQVVRRGELN